MARRERAPTSLDVAATPFCGSTNARDDATRLAPKASATMAPSGSPAACASSPDADNDGAARVWSNDVGAALHPNAINATSATLLATHLVGTSKCDENNARYHKKRKCQR